MKKVTLEEQKKIELDMLKYIKKICDKNNLRYYLAGGTLLGAIRHQGFIPWDDDIDILMPRPDYDKFAEIMKKEKGRYLLLTQDQDDYYYVFNKMVDTKTTLKEYWMNPIKNMGVYLDVFPLDGFPESEEEYNIHADNLLDEYHDFTNSRKDGYKMSNYRWKRIVKRFVKYPLYLMKKNISWKKRQLNLIDSMKKYKYEDSKNVAFILSAYKKKEILNKKIYDDIILVQFEDEKFNAPSGYDDYLKALYGNYMELPPVEKRKTHHFFDAYWKD